jgi:flagellar assembly protein FliH
MSESSSGKRPPPRSVQAFRYAPANQADTGPFQPAAERNPAGAAPSNAGATQGVEPSYDKGLGDGETLARADFEKALAETRSQVSGALRQFTRERETYFSRVETEVVQLALSIARKILHRESQIDPLLLTGVVHVALEKLDASTRVRLRANPEEARFWNGYFSNAKDIFPVAEVVGDPSLAPGNCVLETDLGETRISLETQLKEIEQGFLDLLEHRPKVGE